MESITTEIVLTYHLCGILPHATMYTFTSSRFYPYDTKIMLVLFQIIMWAYIRSQMLILCNMLIRVFLGWSFISFWKDQSSIKKTTFYLKINIYRHYIMTCLSNAYNNQSSERYVRSEKLKLWRIHLIQ